MIVDFSLLRVGSTFTLCGRTYTLVSIGARVLTFDVDGKRVRLGPLSPKWSQFSRDVVGLLVASCHGVDAGALRDCVVNWDSP